MGSSWAVCSFCLMKDRKVFTPLRRQLTQSRTQSLLTSYRACSTKTNALERTGSNSPQIAVLLYCITFQITNQDHLRIGPFQSLRFRGACAVRC